ncbi:MAG: hypothetical protein RL761_383 [Pseudomonadota bacterium]|jgi:hypothetical protein
MSPNRFLNWENTRSERIVVCKSSLGQIESKHALIQKINDALHHCYGAETTRQQQMQLGIRVTTYYADSKPLCMAACLSQLASFASAIAACCVREVRKLSGIMKPICVKTVGSFKGNASSSV